MTMTKDEKEWGVIVRIDEMVESIQEEFKLSDLQMAKALKEKASELNPPKKIAYVLPDGTEISKKDYLKIKNIFSNNPVPKQTEAKK